jgi:cell wall-associated NlpC family hydrolase
MNALLRAARMSPSLLGRFVIVLMVAIGLIGATSVAAAPAQASVATRVGGSSARSSLSAAAGARAVRIAATRRGAPYQWGAVGPRRFDCSGLTMWVYARMGKRLPRTAAQQYAATRHIPSWARRPGDLVFFKTGSGYVHHVGIYAGAGMIWHAPHSGDHVRRARLWTRTVWYGRVR